jgi:omega-amidase
MNITLFQSDTAWLDKDRNLSKIKNVLAHHHSTDLLVLPEMFNTGYIMHPEQGAEATDGDTITKLVNMLKNSHTVIGGSVPTMAEGRYYNTFVFVNRDGLIGQYSKQHLFAPAGEAERYSSGADDVVVPIKDVLVKPLVCYDLRFPYVSYNKDATPYDILVYSANWPVSRIQQWEKLLMARAIENQCYVIGVNRVGKDANGYEYTGHSMIVNHMGEVLMCLDESEQSASFDIDMAAMYEYRSKFPFLKDRKI